MNKEIRVLIKTDYLTGKILSIEDYDGDGEGISVHLEDKYVLEKMKSENKDLFYIDGKIVAREKDAKDYHNRTEKLAEEMQTLREAERTAFLNYSRGVNLNGITDKLISLNKKIKINKQKQSKLKELREKQICNKVMRQIENAKFKYYCSVCMIIKNDNEYLAEWLDWHIKQGVEHFYIYDHDSLQPVSEFIKELPENIRNKITVIQFGGEHDFAQHEAYNDCLNKYRAESRWIGFIDSDEMTRVKENKKLPEFLKEFENSAGLFIGWEMYGANGRVKKSAEPVRQRFTRLTEYTGQDGVGKVFVQPYMMRQMLTHNGYTVDGFGIVDEEHNAVECGQAWKYGLPHEKICIDHYYTKSYEEWIEKISRGSCDPYYCRKYEEFFKYNPEMEFCRESLFPEQKYEGKKKIKIKGENHE